MTRPPFLYFRCGTVKVIDPENHRDVTMTEQEACHALLAHADLIKSCETILADVEQYLRRGGTLTETEQDHVMALRLAVGHAKGEQP